MCNDRSPEMVVAEPAGSPNERPPRDAPFGVPRRFGIGTILIITAAFGLLLSLLQACGAPTFAVWFVIIFVSLIGLGQMTLFGGDRPRKASIVTGAVCLPLMTSATVALFRSRPALSFETALGIFHSLIYGAGLGYLAGGLVAGVFLIMDALESQLRRVRSRRLIEPKAKLDQKD